MSIKGTTIQIILCLVLDHKHSIWHLETHRIFQRKRCKTKRLIFIQFDGLLCKDRENI